MTAAIVSITAQTVVRRRGGKVEEEGPVLGISVGGDSSWSEIDGSVMPLNELDTVESALYIRIFLVTLDPYVLMVTPLMLPWTPMTESHTSNPAGKTTRILEYLY